MYVSIKPTGDFSTNFTLSDSCKICKNITCPTVVNETTQSIDNDHYRFCATRYCQQCNHYFVDEIEVTVAVDSFASIDYQYDILDVKPELPSDIAISKELAKLSPIGKEIYTQALKAEQEKLDHIAGIGFRKSLEFFVKDFVISFELENKDKVAKMPLKQVIDNYIDNKTLKTFATATVYIGNDETHYTKKHSDKDLQDLKKFLHGFLHYMEMQLNLLNAYQLLDR